MRLDRKLLDTVRKGREDKEAAKEQKLYLGGRPSAEFKERWPDIERKTTDALSEHAELIRTEWEKVLIRHEENGTRKNAPDIDSEKLIAAFKKAFLGRMKSAVLMEKTTWRDVADGDDSFDTLFDQAIFDFVMTLRRSARRDDTALTALSYAGLSHWIDPNEFERLSGVFPAVDKTVLSAAMVSNPKDPAAIVRAYSQEIESLIKRYELKVDIRDIKYALHSYPKNPGRFIQWYKDSRDALIASMPWLEEKQVRPILYANHFKSVPKLLDIVVTS